MHSKRNIVIVCIFFIVGITLVYGLLTKINSKTLTSLVSPLPLPLTNSNSQVYGLTTSIWKPVMNEYNLDIKKPHFSAFASISYDLTTDKLLYENNSKKRTPIASLTKIMTALVALEDSSIDKRIKVTKSAAEIGENSMGLTGGEELTLEELLYGLVLPSGNDAAEALAQGSLVGRDNFVYMMNKKAEDLGLSDTHFTNPSGLEGDGNQYSTAHDLLVITRYALENSEFAKVVSAVTYYIEQTQTHKAYSLFNETNLLTSYPGVKGVKIGYTDEAGLCIVTYLEYDGHRVIAILLNSLNRRQEMKDLLDYSLETLGITPPPHQ